MSELVEGFEKLCNIAPSVSVFGCARTRPDSPRYQLAEIISRKLSDAGFSMADGGGTMEAANKGAYAGKSPGIGLGGILPSEQSANVSQDIGLHFRHFFSPWVMFIKHASAYVALPGGFATLDEILTPVQTGKTRRVPVILAGINQMV